ncbi:MAG: 50S ribosomal protein L25/general stress protein Ctc [Xanthomonadaceae bacterium]|nr:50S ribosomal protein L25/general stress protein Ctc [Xanthomonadaceae bacterium]MDP2186507.1 50S ribosomal protein L25/general stress protein Ctc [Xanthomonadales bacterium]MDZ4115455.1 50S ribosomal protein L25/general stress protein Ctc [Xanthomonadaceae bacterium]MDZ4379005.1 50S ribosomal protein L25/general stress protein Ctc [Xanthomonadaceae bacterium]
MSQTHKLSATARGDQGKGASRRLRRLGRLPAVVYGGHQEPASIDMHHNDVFLASANEWFYSSLIELDIDGKTERVLLRDMQRHPFKPVILHLDFLRVSENEALRARVPLHFLNQDVSPAGKSASVVIHHDMTELEVSCLPKDLPEFIAVDLANLALGDIVHLSELVLPAGVEVPALKLGKEHDVAVVSAKHTRTEVEEEGAEAAAGAEVPAAKQAAPEKK